MKASWTLNKMASNMMTDILSLEIDGNGIGVCDLSDGGGRSFSSLHTYSHGHLRSLCRGEDAQ